MADDDRVILEVQIDDQASTNPGPVDPPVRSGPARDERGRFVSPNRPFFERPGSDRPANGGSALTPRPRRRRRSSDDDGDPENVIDLVAPIARDFSRGGHRAVAGKLVKDLSAVPAIAVGMASALAVTTAGVYSFREALKQAQEAVEFSPGVAAAQGLSSVREFQGRIRRAGELEDELQQTVLLNSEISENIEEIKVEIQKILLPAVNGAAQALSDILTVVNVGADGLRFIRESPQKLAEALTQSLGLDPSNVEVISTLLPQVLQVYLNVRERINQRDVDKFAKEFEDFLDPEEVD